MIGDKYMIELTSRDHASSFYMLLTADQADLLREVEALSSEKDLDGCVASVRFSLYRMEEI